MIGLAWQIGEDALDRYLIRGFEDRVESPWARLLVRSGLNPTRSFANLLRGKVPWHRDSRQGIYKYRGEIDSVPDPPPSSPRTAKVPPFQFTTSSQYTLSPGPRESLHCVGGLATAEWNLSGGRSWVAEVSGCKMIDQRQNLSGDIMTYMTGPKWSDRRGRWRPFAQVLTGGKRVTIDEFLPDRKAMVEAANPGRSLGYEFHRQWTKTNQANGLAISLGCGLDYALTRSATWRIASFDYSYAWLPKPELASYPHSVRIAMGITIHIGNW